MPVEEQTQWNTIAGLSGEFEGKKWAGQHFLIPPNRTIATLAFYLVKLGGPTGDVTFTIEEYPTSIILNSKVWGDASDVPTTYPPTEWTEVKFGTPILIDVLARILVKFSGGDGSNQIALCLQSSGSVKPDEEFVQDVTGLDSTKDAAYRYTYITPPTVTTDPATGIEAAAATGKGNITDNGGEDCDERGFVYNTSPHGDPGDTAPADSEYSNYVEETNSFGTGAFTGALTSLEPKTTYYVRAYAHNSAGYSYGNEVSFTTLVAASSVTTNPASALSAIAATLNGTLNQDGGEVCQCGFEWGLDIGYGVTTPPQSKTTSETFSQVIGGLIPNTVYHFRAFATNSVGTSYGVDRTFTTALVISRAFALAREEL